MLYGSHFYFLLLVLSYRFLIFLLPLHSIQVSFLFHKKEEHRMKRELGVNPRQSRCCKLS